MGKTSRPLSGAANYNSLSQGSVAVPAAAAAAGKSIKTHTVHSTVVANARSAKKLRTPQGTGDGIKPNIDAGFQWLNYLL